jgi:hypothetical protein
MKFPFYTPTLARVLFSQGKIDAFDEVVAELEKTNSPHVEALKAMKGEFIKERLERLLSNVQKAKTARAQSER